MRSLVKLLHWTTFGCLVSILPIEAAETSHRQIPDTIEFNRDVRPILSDNCFYCHGPDKNTREAGLRLDTLEGLLSADEHASAVVPGNSADSELIRRILSSDPDEQMPPPETGKTLSQFDREILKRWIDQGGEFQGHWSFLPIPSVAKASSHPSVAKTIDAHVARSLQTIGLNASPEADRITLIRRLSFDLIGLPPTPDEVDAFVNDTTPDAYEKLVDRLLQSPHFGERLAIWWLDLVRYADTVGYHGDQPVSVSPFRQYVIDSFNENKPFDQFTIEQLAGDLLPNPTLQQQIRLQPSGNDERRGRSSAEGVFGEVHRRASSQCDWHLDGDHVGMRRVPRS
jgi:Protein of unknown function (DUF1549)/Planctomycete cytochrome C